MVRSLNTGSNTPSSTGHGKHADATKTSKPDRAINPHELDALYQAGTLTVVGSNSHYAGLRAVYDAGAKR